MHNLFIVAPSRTDLHDIKKRESRAPTLYQNIGIAAPVPRHLNQSGSEYGDTSEWRSFKDYSQENARENIES